MKLTKAMQETAFEMGIDLEALPAVSEESKKYLQKIGVETDPLKSAQQTADLYAHLWGESLKELETLRKEVKKNPKFNITLDLKPRDKEDDKAFDILIDLLRCRIYPDVSNPPTKEPGLYLISMNVTSNPSVTNDRKVDINCLIVK